MEKILRGFNFADDQENLTLLLTFLPIVRNCIGKLEFK